jgi:putative ABC transport system permease protein
VRTQLSSLDRKLLRELRRIWAQALAVALVIAAGVATYVLANGAYRSLEETRTAYYERHRFAHVFADVVRAPLALAERLAEIPGVAAVETRIEALGLLDVPGQREPATGRAISLPDHGAPVLSVPYLRVGRLPEPGRPDEVTVNEAFAAAHGFGPGAQLAVILHGKKRQLTIVGLALSPEHIYALGPGDLMPDDRRFAVLWMSRAALAGLLDLDGAFNSVQLALARGASEAAVVTAADHLLARYGGAGAYGRAQQLSHAFLDAELQQLAAMARVLPPIFLVVSAFLINMILSRLVSLELEQIGLLKAIGYGRTAIAMHYVKMAALIAVVGIVVGWVAGAWLGHGLTRIYADFFHFPFLLFRHDVNTYLVAGAISIAAAVAGTVRSLGEALSLPPAVAMQPRPPPRYRRLLPDGARAWLSARLGAASPLTVMAFRHMLRWPLRAATTLLGIALACGLLITALLSFDSIEHMIDVAFHRTDRQHATIILAERGPPAVTAAIARLPGVLRAEPYRVVPVRLVSENRSKRLSITGKPEGRDLSRVLDTALAPVTLPETGLALSAHVAQFLKVERGDRVTVETLEGKRRKVEVPVTDIIESYFGLMVFMRSAALDELMDEGPRISGVHIAYDRAEETALFAAVKATPAIGSIAMQRIALVRFRETLAQNINYMITVYVTLAIVIVVGVVYNSARIQLSERARELASLRVLGFTRGEVSSVLLSELALIALTALPVGWMLGYGFGRLLIWSFSSDLYRVPFTIEVATYAKASLVVLAATAVSAAIVRRRIDRLDMVSVLKSRD